MKPLVIVATGWSDQLSGQEFHLLKIRAFFTAHCYGKTMRGLTPERGHASGKTRVGAHPLYGTTVRLPRGLIRSSQRAVTSSDALAAS